MTSLKTQLCLIQVGNSKPGMCMHTHPVKCLDGLHIPAINL